MLCNDVDNVLSRVRTDVSGEINVELQCSATANNSSVRSGPLSASSPRVEGRAED